MNTCVITFRSVTFAQRGEGVLRRAGLGCTLQRTPRWMEEQGCGYSLRLRHRDGAAAVRLLRESNIAFRKVYLHDGSGTLEELVL